MIHTDRPRPLAYLSAHPASIPTPSLQASQRGFTLIEVMVALAILAVVAVAATQASSAYLRSVEVLRTRTLAHFVAQNTAAKLAISQTWLTADQSKSVHSQGRDWQVQMSVADTMTPSVKSVTIAVAPVINGVTKNNVTDITVMIVNPDTSVSAAEPAWGDAK